MAETRLSDSHDPGFEIVRDQLNVFAYNPGLAEVAGLYGVTDLPADRTTRLAKLQTVADSHWDFRKGKERQDTNWDSELLDDPESEQWQTVFNGANALGQVQSGVLANTSPDYLCVYGGNGTAPHTRTKYALEAAKGFKQIVYLGSSRELKDAERDKVAEYAPDARTEFDLGVAAFEMQLGARAVNEEVKVLDDDMWVAREYQFEHEGEAKTGFALSTPIIVNRGRDRATTYDNLRSFARFAHLTDQPQATVAGVTTALYVPSQHLPALHELTLPYGTSVETIGHSAEYSGITRKPAQLLQEVRTALGRAVRLDTALQTV